MRVNKISLSVPMGKNVSDYSVVDGENFESKKASFNYNIFVVV